MAEGLPFPLGVTLRDGGVNVAAVSRHADAIFICLFEGDTETHRFRLKQRLGDVHYGFIENVKPGDRYGLRAEGPWDAANGHRFDVSKLLVDPYATAIDRAFVHHPALTERGTDSAAIVPKCMVEEYAGAVAPLPPHTPHFIYEIPVRAFTMRHPGISPDQRGTVAALAHPAVISHLTTLGVDTVELMPLAAWIDERHLPPLRLRNAWGYNPVSFMAPDPRLAPGGFAEIARTVAALHAANIRVVLDVVFNHTGESDTEGATVSLRGLDNALYYAHANGRLVNDSGCGNTLALDRAPVIQLVMDAMRTWIRRTGIDGFRFDLATVMGRTGLGFANDAPLLAAIAQDTELSQLILIAEPWDIGNGGYQLGGFPARWLEWNDRYRDDVRRFWRGDGNSAGALATRLSGSSDIFAPRRRPSCSINFLAAHDGFTLRDTVTYARKDNAANGENDRDGNANEVTWPGGDIRALLATLFLSRGTPMLTAGDEFGRTQHGNNNAYAQDNELTWLDWENADRSLIAFTGALMKLRRVHPDVFADRFLSEAEARWIGADGESFDWGNPKARDMGLVVGTEAPRHAIWINGGTSPVRPQMPVSSGFRWTMLFGSAEGADLPPHSVALFAEEKNRQTGLSDETLSELAGEAGIERDWWEVDGTHHRAPPDTVRALLAALNLPHGNPGEASEALRHLRQAPRAISGIAGERIVVGEAGNARVKLVCASDEGERAFEFAPGEVPAVTLPAGIYDVRMGERTRRLLISPGACYLPQPLGRHFGLASHLYALRHKGDGGIGDFETLRRFGKAAAVCGGTLAGINPLHHLFPSDRNRASPYQPSDRRYIDPIYIGIAQLLERLPLPRSKNLAQKSRAAFARLEALPFVDYGAVWRAKSAILEAAFGEFKGSTAFENFVKAGGETLTRHGAFEARAAGENAADPQRIRYRAFLQWVAGTQLAAAAAHRNLYRDLALGSAFDGGEIAEQPGIFANGVSLGSPPDPFSRSGQVWNLPPFSPLALQADGFDPMRAILAANMRHAAALRIDHILGFARQFWVPRGAEGRHGAYVRFPTDDLLALTAIESHRNRCMIVGEDLGTIPDGLREKLSAANILSYRVLWFERDGLNFKPPESYPALALACLASHDLPTFAGWRQGRDIAIERELGLIGNEAALNRTTTRGREIEALDNAAGGSEPIVAAHRFVASTPSAVMLIQVDDMAGETEPLNVPGTDLERPNWRRRIALSTEDVMQQPLSKSILDAVKQERPLE